MGLPNVQLHGHAQIHGQIQLPFKHGALGIPGGQVVMIIQANFPHRPTPGMLCRLQQNCFGFRGIFDGVMRMHAHHEIQKIMRLTHFLGEGYVLGGVHGQSGVANAGLQHALDHLIPVFGKLIQGNMAMGIKQIHNNPRCS